jgi:hypothetical protein
LVRSFGGLSSSIFGKRYSTTARNVTYEIGIPMTIPRILRGRFICASGIPPTPRKAATKLPKHHGYESASDRRDEEEQEIEGKTTWYSVDFSPDGYLLGT